MLLSVALLHEEEEKSHNHENKRSNKDIKGRHSLDLEKEYLTGEFVTVA